MNVCNFFSLFFRMKLFLFLFKFIIKLSLFSTVSSTSFPLLMLFYRFSVFTSSTLSIFAFGSGGFAYTFFFGDLSSLSFTFVVLYSSYSFSLSFYFCYPNNILLKSIADDDFLNKLVFYFSKDLDLELIFSIYSIY